MSISEIVYGIDKVADISSSVPQMTADEGRLGWEYVAVNPTDIMNLTLFSEDGITNTNNLFHINFRCSTGNNTYTDFPYLEIKTKPKGDGSDVNPSYHSREIYEIPDTGFTYPDELVYVYYNNLLPYLSEFKKIKLILSSTEGTVDPNNPILSIQLITNASSTSKFYIQSSELVSKNSPYPFNRVIEFRQKDLIQSEITGDLEDIKTAVQSIDNKITVGSDDTLSEAQQVLTYARKDATPSGLRALKCADDGTLHSFDTGLNLKISKGNDFTLSEAQQVLVYGEVTSGPGTGELHPIHITNSGDIEVEIADFVKGQDTMANSFPVVIASDQSVLSVEDTATTSIDTKITVGEDDTLTQAQQILIYGRKDSSPTGLSAVKVSSDGSLHVSTAKNSFNKTNEILVLPSNGTANSTAINTLSQDSFGITATSTNSTDPIELYSSNDNLTFYPTNITGSSGTFYHEIYHPSFNYYRISQTDTTTTAGSINVISSKR